MRNVRTSVLVILALAALGLLMSVGPGIAVPTGVLNITNGLGGGAIFSGTSVDWVPPVGPPNGSLATGLGTNIAFTGGPLGPGVLGSITDVSFGAPSVSRDGPRGRSTAPHHSASSSSRSRWRPP